MNLLRRVWEAIARWNQEDLATLRRPSQISQADFTRRGWAATRVAQPDLMDVPTRPYGQGSSVSDFVARKGPWNDTP